MLIHTKPSYRIVVFIILIAIGIRMLLLINTENFDTTSVWEISNCYRFVLHPFNFLQYFALTSATTSQAGHYFLNAVLSYFFDEPVLVSRIVSFIFGILLIILYYLLVKSVFSQGIAWASILALAFYSIHVQISVASFAHTGVLFFVILGLYFLTRYLYGSPRSRYYFTVSIISTILATTLRLDSWFVPFIFALIILQKRRFKETLLFLVLSSSYIIVTCYIFYMTHRTFFPFLSNLLTQKDILQFFSGSHKFSFDKYQIFTGLRTIFHRFFNPALYQGILKTLTSTIGVTYGKYRALVWINALFYTLSLPLSVLGFLGMLIAVVLKYKKHYIFLISFWSNLIILTVAQFLTHISPTLRYSHIFAIFFIPFIFFGVSKIGFYICQLFCLNYSYKKALVISLIIISNLYFIFFSVSHLIKKIPEMKFSPLCHQISDWMKKYVCPQDIMLFSFDSVLLCFGTTANKFIDISYNEDVLYNALISNKEYTIDKETIDRLVDFVKGYNLEARSGLNPIYISLLVKRGQPQGIRRIVFILDERVYSYLKDSHPQLLEKIEINHNNGFYTCILPLNGR